MYPLETPLTTIVAIVFTMSSIVSYAGERVCDDARSKAAATIDANYKPVITTIDVHEKELKAANIDPTKFPYFDENNHLQTIDLTKLKSDLEARQKTDLEQINAQINQECDEKMKPIQNVVDVAKAIATLGVSEILPERMTNIDVSNILNGHPLGEDTSLVPKMREDALKAIGASGENNDIRRIVSNPVSPWKWVKW